MSKPGADLEDLRARRKVWLEWLDGDPLHSINHQLSNLLWHDAAFRIFNHARKLANAKAGAAAISPLLAPALDQGYLDAMTTGVTKLTERSDPKHPKKGVISLRRLVDDLRERRSLLTRENYLAIDGYPYDYAPIMQADIAKRVSPDSATFFFGGDPDPAKDWMAAERFHGQFDRISGVSPDERSPSDLVSEQLLQRLDEAFDDEIFARLRNLRNKVVAHAADAYSRGSASPRGISLDEAERVLRALLGIRQVVQAGILNDSWRAGAVPVPQYNQFEHLDKPFVTTNQIDELRTVWDEHSKSQDDWLTGGFDTFLK